MQLPLLVPESSWRPPRISELPSWQGAKRVAVDIETYDPQLRDLGPGVRRGGYIAGVSFAIEDGPAHYLPLRHHGGDNMEDPDAALGWLREQAKNYCGEIVGANLSYDLDFCIAAGIRFPNIKCYRDVQVAAALINELAMSFSLETLCQKYLGVGKDENKLREAAVAYNINPKKDLHLLPARFVGAYAEADSALPLLVLRRQEKEIDEEDLWKVFNLESELLPILVDMRQRGVRIDLDHLSVMEKWSTEQERLALMEVKRLTGIEIPLNSVWQSAILVPALQNIGCKIPLTPKTKKPSIDKAFLGSIKHPVAEAINRARRVNKVRTTFVNSIREHMVNGRIHGTLNQLRSSTEEDEDGAGAGARYGRLSAQNPNLQQQPARDPEIGHLWRAIFIPDEGKLWGSFDYSAQEPRLAVHYAATTRLDNICINNKWIDVNKIVSEVVKKYNDDPNMDPYTWMSEAADILRKDAKTLYLGMSYGMGGYKLCNSLNLPTMKAVRDPINKSIIPADSDSGRRLAASGQKIFESAGIEGQALLNKFDAAVPYVRSLSKLTEKAAKKYGYVRTIDGRKCHFPKDTLGNYDWTFKAFNRIIQATAAGQMKQAMVNIEKGGFALQLQVHDEVCLSLSQKEDAGKIAKIMCESYPLVIPSKVDISIGKNWGDDG